MDDKWQSPSAAWAAAALCFTTIPVCVYPIAVTVRERLQQKAPSHFVRPRAPSNSPGLTAYLSHTFTLAFWLLIAACHVGLLVYSILAATETSDDCDDGQPPDRGWATGVRKCFKGKFVSVIDLSEVVLVSVYPITLLKVYIEIHSSSNAMSKFRRRLMRRAFHLTVCAVGMLTAILLFTTVADRITLYIHPSALSPQVRAVHEWGAVWQATSFSVWFAVLVSSAAAALVLTIRLLPHLKRRDQPVDSNGTHSQPKQQRNSATSSFTKPGSAPSSTSTFKLFSTLSVPILSGPSSPSATMASARLRGCIRRLWIILLVVAIVLVVNVAIVGMTYVYGIGHVTTCVSGWVSCHIITMAFFSAKRVVREAVIARRQLPSEVGVGTVVTEWQETGTTESSEG